jgi:hypothetical protein
LLIALIKLDVVVEATDNSFPGNLVNVAVETTIVAVNVLNRVNNLLSVAVDVAETDNVLNKVSNLLNVAVVADVTENVLR